MAEAEILSTLAKNRPADGFKSPAALTGKSGVRHTFSFSLGAGDRPEIVCDVIVGRMEQDETRVLSLFIKTFDVGSTRAMLCVSPKLTKEASKLAMLYNILTLESPDPEQLPQMIESVLKRLEAGGRGSSVGGRSRGGRQRRHPA